MIRIQIEKSVAAIAFAVLIPVHSLASQDLRVRPEGVTEEIEAAIQRGLEALKRLQSADGSWRSAGRRGMYPTAMTALAGMAFLGSGSTPTRGPHYQVVRNAMTFLLSSAQADGVITVANEEARSMYGHGFSTMFLAETYGMEEDEKRQREIHAVLTRAVRLIARAQSRAGGWLYTPESNGDEGSVTVTQIQALRACRNAGVTVPVETIDRAIKYIHNSANPDGSIRYSAHGGGAGRPPITAAAVAVLYNAGEYEDPVAERALQYAMKTLPIQGSGNSHHYYSQLYLAQALYQKGGEDWAKYYEKMAEWLLAQQSRDGTWAGDSVGDVYGTAIALTILQLPYGYVPIYQR